MMNVDIVTAQANLIKAQQDYINALINSGQTIVTQTMPTSIAEEKTSRIPVFGEFAKRFMEIERGIIKPTSYANYQFYLQSRVLPFLKDYRLDEITNSVLQEFANKLLEELSIKSAKEHVAFVKNILNLAKREEIIPDKRFYIKFPKKEKEDYRVLSDDEFDKLQAAMLQEKSPIALGIIIAMNTGLRIGEICGLMWEDIDFEKNIISVNKTVNRYYDCENKTTHLNIGTTKTFKSTRVVPMTRQLNLLLKEKQCESNIYVASGKSKPTEPRTLRQAYSRRLKKLEIAHITFHGIRHTFATRAIKAGIDPKTVAELMGHERCEMTLDVYASCTDEMKAKAIEILSEQ